MDNFGFVKAVDRFTLRVIVAVSAIALRELDTRLGEMLAGLHLRAVGAAENSADRTMRGFDGWSDTALWSVLRSLRRD